MLDTSQAAYTKTVNYQSYPKDQHSVCIVGSHYSSVSRKQSSSKKDKRSRSNYGERILRRKYGMNGDIKLENGYQLFIIKMGLVLPLRFDYG